MKTLNIKIELELEGLMLVLVQDREGRYSKDMMMPYHNSSFAISQCIREHSSYIEYKRALWFHMMLFGSGTRYSQVESRYKDCSFEGNLI